MGLTTRRMVLNLMKMKRTMRIITGKKPVSMFPQTNKPGGTATSRSKVLISQVPTTKKEVMTF